MNAIIHNAGIYLERSRGSNPEGHAKVLAVNTLAPYILTALIKRPQRLIYLSSGMHRSANTVPSLCDTAHGIGPTVVGDLSLRLRASSVRRGRFET
jgi:hypothetical protein